MKIVIVGLVYLFLVFNRCAAFDQIQSENEVFNNWISKGKAIKSFRVEWTETNRDLMRETSTPEKTVEYVLKKKLIVLDSNLRYEFVGKQFDGTILRDVDSVSVFSENQNRELRSEHEYPNGMIRGLESVTPGMKVVNTLPILASLRPVDRRLGRLAGVRSVGAHGVLVRSNKCTEIKFGEKTTVWMSEDVAMPIRIVTFSAGKVARQYDLKYLRKGEHDLLSSWTIESPTIGSSVSAEVSSFVVNDPSIRKDLFSLEFPIGTRVTDMSNGSTSKTVQNFIVRENGERRAILKTERGATYDQLLKTESGKALEGSYKGFTRSRIVLGVGILFVVSVVSICMFKSLRSKG